MKRKSQWIRGFEFFEFTLEYNRMVFDEVLSFFDENIPLEIQEFLKHFVPIETWDKSKYEESVQFVSSKYILDDSIMVNDRFDQFLPFYSLVEIKNRLYEREVELTLFYENEQFLPICQSVPNGDIVISLKNNSSKGKLYYIVDYYDYNASHLHEYLFCNGLFEFIAGLKEVPR